jgi:hypothetical protein
VPVITRAQINSIENGKNLLFITSIPFINLK